MNRTMTVIGTLFVAFGCGCDSSDAATEQPLLEAKVDSTAREIARDPASTGNSDFNHIEGEGSNANADNTPQKIENDNRLGGVDVAARLHACGKLSYTAFGGFLRSRGVVAGAGMSAYNGAAGSLGIANYPARIAEADFPSASAFAKQFDIFAVAAPDLIKNLKTSKACPGVELLSADGKTFLKDGISCLIGVPASDAHVTIANQAIAENAQDGAQIAVAALLSQAWSCQ
jgi:diadenosine tetraphosphatase ApaH/serine/threonine PP2A family protein phosphatase